MGKIIITPDELATSAHKYRKDLIQMPMHSMRETTQHMTVRRGIRYAETVGELSGDIDLGPYSETREDDNNMNIKGRTLYTYLGSVIKNFSPNSVVQSIYDSITTKGENLKTVDIALRVLSYLTAKMGHNLQSHIWNAVRNDNGTTSADLFNGFDTITANEITDSKITTALGNLYEFGEAITASNAVDQIKAFCEAASEFLVDAGQETKLFCSPAIYRAYLKDYQSTVGAIPYNTEYRKAVVEGFENVHFVPLYNKADSPYIHLSAASNMLVGVNQEGEDENITVEKHHAFILQYIATMFFGVQFESINPERLLVGKLYQAPTKVATPTFSPTTWAEGATLTVELATTTDGATIYYTDDGTTPTSASTAYNPSNKITLSATKTLKAIAVKDGMTNSDVATQAYTKPG